MAWLNLSSQQALNINQTIDRFHEPYQWITLAILASFFILEVFLPLKEKYESSFDRYLSNFKFSIIVLMSLVAISQGLTGGCVIQIPQNYLAKEYLGMKEWYPYGVVFRELFPSTFEPYLRLIYFMCGLLAPYLSYRYWFKRLKNPNLNLKKSKSVSKQSKLVENSENTRYAV